MNHDTLRRRALTALRDKLVDGLTEDGIRLDVELKYPHPLVAVVLVPREDVERLIDQLRRQR